MRASDEGVLIDASLRDADPEIVGMLLPVARNMVLSGAPAHVIADIYRAEFALAPPHLKLQVDRAMGAVVRFARSAGHRREARLLAAVVRKSR